MRRDDRHRAGEQQGRAANGRDGAAAAKGSSDAPMGSDFQLYQIIKILRRTRRVSGADRAKSDHPLEKNDKKLNAFIIFHVGMSTFTLQRGLTRTFTPPDAVTTKDEHSKLSLHLTLDTYK